MDLEETCQSRGVRIGRYRRSILHILAGEQRHASVDEIYQAIRPEHPTIRIATVYRTVKILEEAGVLVRLDLGDGVMRYETADHTRHDHLIDQQTGTVVEFQEEHIQALLSGIAARLGYTLTGYRLNLYGFANTAERPEATAPGSFPGMGATGI